jgi:hypothetical protein
MALNPPTIKRQLLILKPSENKNENQQRKKSQTIKIYNCISSLTAEG